MLPLLRDAWYADIATVIAAGNDPGVVLGEFTPQRYGRPDNALITVASMDPIGLRSTTNPSEGGSRYGIDPMLTGSITVYAQGVNVKLAKANDRNQLYYYAAGSSIAAPQVD